MPFGIRKGLGWGGSQRRPDAERVDVLVELAEADRGDLAVEMSEVFPLFREEGWKDFPGPCILTLGGRERGPGS